MIKLSIQDVEGDRFNECISVGRKFYLTSMLLWKYSDLMNITGNVSLLSFVNFFGMPSKVEILLSGNRNSAPFNSLHRGFYSEPIGGVERGEIGTKTVEVFRIEASPNSSFFMNFYEYLDLYDYLNYHNRLQMNHRVDVLKKLHKVVSKTVPIEVNIGNQFVVYQTGCGRNKYRHGMIRSGRHSLVAVMLMSDEMLEFIKRLTGLMCISTHFFNYIYSGRSREIMRKLVDTYASWNPYINNPIGSFSEYRILMQTRKNLFDLDNLSF